MEPDEGLTTETISANRGVAYTLFYSSSHTDDSLYVARRTPELSKQSSECERMAGSGRKFNAASCYRVLIRKHPDDVALKTDFAALLASVCSAAFYSGRKLSYALKACDESLSLRPEEIWAYEARGGVHLKLGHWHEAIADFSFVFKRLPVADAHYGRSLALRRIGDEEAAQRDLKQAKELQPLIERTFGVSIDAAPRGHGIGAK